MVGVSALTYTHFAGAPSRSFALSFRFSFSFSLSLSLSRTVAAKDAALLCAGMSTRLLRECRSFEVKRWWEAQLRSTVLSVLHVG